MIANDEFKKHKACSQLLDDGKYKEALALAESLSIPAFRAAIFIDGGFALGKSGKVREGTEIFEKLLESDQPEQHFSKSSLLYNAANGRSSLYTLRRQRRTTVIPTNDFDLRIAKKHYRDAIFALDEKSGSFVSQVWTNYGNCLSQFGRYIEAIESYEKALDADPAHGMAAGNLGIELEHASRIIGRHRHEYIALAHDYLTRALGSGMHLNSGSPGAPQYFRSALERLQHFINAHREPILPPQPAEAVARSHSQKDYIQFCIKNGLFLNSWVGNKELSPGITDDVYFGPIVTPVGDDYLVPELLRILNEIKESFTTARYLCYLSQKQNNVLDAMSKMTLYYGTDTFAIHGLYTGLCKAAYARAFDVLDKVARIVNVYFKIGKREDSFWEVFAEKQSLGEAHTIRFVARPAICKTENLGLYALADLCIDYFESERADLKTQDMRRNRITHDYLNVKLHATDAELKETDTVDLDDLQDQTRNVLHLAKGAILYAVSAINMAERQNEPTAERRFELEYFSNPGQSFL